MATSLQFDAEAAAQVRAISLTPDVVATRGSVFHSACPAPGETVLDVGCGPGFLLRDLAKAVGPNGRAIGTDISGPMLAKARAECGGLENVELREADALSLPLRDASVDLACVLQVYAYVPDIDGALSELGRVLKPGGRAVILDSDMSSFLWESHDRERMKRIQSAYDAHVAWPDLPRILPARLRAAGLRITACRHVPIVSLSYHANTYCYGLARFIHRFLTNGNVISRAEADAWIEELDELQREGAFFFSCCRHQFTVLRDAPPPRKGIERGADASHGGS